MVSPFGIPMSPEDEPQQPTFRGIPLAPSDEPQTWSQAASLLPPPSTGNSDLDQRLAGMASQWEGRRYQETPNPVGISIQPEAVSNLYNWYSKYGQYGPIGAGLRAALSPIEAAKETYGVATTPLISYTDLPGAAGTDIVRSIVERAGTPATYIGGIAPAGLTILGAGLGETAKETTRALGGGETAQEIASLAGEFAPFGKDIYHIGGSLYRLTDRGLTALTGAEEAALRKAVPETFEFGRGQTLEEFGGFPRRQIIGAAEETAGAAKAAEGAAKALPSERIPVWKQYGPENPPPESSWQPLGEVQYSRGERPPTTEIEPTGTKTPSLIPRDFHAEMEPGSNLAALQERERTSAPEGIFNKSYSDRAKSYFYQKGMNVPAGIQEAAYQVGGLEKPSPVLGKVRQYTTPGATMTDDVFRSVNARDNVIGELSSRMAPSRNEILQTAESLFGKDFSRPNVEYVGPETRNQAFLENGKVVTRPVPASKFGVASDGKPLTGTMLDMMQNPDYYRLTPEQRNFFQNVIDPRNEELTRTVNGLYGTDIGVFRPDNTGYVPGSRPVFMPNINTNEEIPAYVTSRGATREGRVYDTASQRVANDPDFRPEINIPQLLNRLDEAKARAAGNETLRALLGVSDSKLAGTSQVQSLGGYLPHDEAKQVADFLRTEPSNSNFNKVIRLASAIDQVVLGGTMEMLGTHGSIAAISNKRITARAVLGSIANMAREGDILYPFRNSSMAKDIAKNPSWGEFFAYSGRDPRSIANPGAEFSGGILSSALNKVGLKAIPDAAFNIITRQQKSIYDSLADGLIRQGMPENQAKAAAAWQANHVVPMFNPSREGMSKATAQLQASGLTSTSTTRATIELLGAGLRGLAKMGTLHEASPQEQLAAKSLLSFVSTLLTGAAATAAYDAHLRGTDVKKAVDDAVTPGSGKFGHWFVPGTGYHSKMGASMTSILEAVVPKIQKVDGKNTPVPLSGLFTGDFLKDVKSTPADYVKGTALATLGGYGKYAESRVAPWAQFAKGVISNKDYYGNPILPGDFAHNAVGNLIAGTSYAARSLLPISGQVPAEALHRGENISRAAIEMPVSFFGAHISGPTKYQELDDETFRATGKHWADLTPGEQLKLSQKNPKIKPLSEEYSIDRAMRDPDFAQAKQFTDTAKSQLQEIEENVKRGTNQYGQPYTVKDARTRIAEITDTLAAQKEGVYANAGTKPGKDPILDSYYEAIKNATDKTGKLNSVAIAKWHEENDSRVAPDGSSWGDYLFENTGTALRGVSIYDNLRNAKNVLAKSGYWKIQDQSAQQFGQMLGIPVKDRSDLEQKIKEYAIKNAGPQNAPLLETRIMGNYSRINSMNETQFLMKNPYIGQVLKAWGYSEPVRAQALLP